MVLSRRVALFLALTIVGGCTGSTAGGIKGIRVGIAFKTLLHDVKRILLPESALVITTYHAGRRRILRDVAQHAAPCELGNES